jgi:hypothetical protein
MKWAALAFAVIACGCGDNSTVCGPDTSDIDGECIPATTCGPGTRDDGAGECVPDATDCQNGTVLINGVCVEPTIDLEEGPEPNGLGISAGEASNGPAGTIVLKDEGESTVVHGHLTPFRDNDGDGQIDPDYDTYLLSVTKPTLIEVSIAGINGIDGAFFVRGSTLGLGHWERYGVAVTGTSTQRPLYLPVAGDYFIVVADTRSMTLGNLPPVSGVAATVGGPDAQYYMSLTVMPTPTPTPITLASNVATVQGTIGTDNIQFYTAPLGLGFNTAALTIAQDQANPSLVVLNNNAFRAQDTGDITALGDAALSVAGIDSGDTTVIVVDPSFNTAFLPVPFELDIASGDASPIPTSGGSASEPVLTTTPDVGFDRFNVYFFDVGSLDELDGLLLHASIPIDAVVLDENRFVQAYFTIDRATLTFAGNTFTDYKGALRFPTPGRYYLVAYAPGATIGDTLAITSTVANMTPTTVMEGVPLAGQTTNAFDLLPFLYDAGATDIWQTFDITGTSTGDRTATFMDPLLAYGSLGSLAITTPLGPAVVPPDPPVIFSHTFAASPSQIGRIVGDDPTHAYLIAVSTASAGSIALDFAARTFVDLGTADAGDTKTHDDQLTTAMPRRFYLIRSNTGNTVTLSVSPAANLEIRVLAIDEATKQLFAGAGGLHGFDSHGLVAFEVDSTQAIGAPIDVTVTAHVGAAFYGIHAGTTAFVDICPTGTPVVFAPDSDDGLSTPIDTPAGFTFYGAAAPKVVVSSNGWLSFDTSVVDSVPIARELPDGSGEVNIAPLWGDLVTTAACTQASGTKLIVQWLAGDFSGTGEFQAILDAADNSIELVYGLTTLDGSTSVTGVQNAVDEQSTQIAAFTQFVTPNTSFKLSHP